MHGYMFFFFFCFLPIGIYGWFPRVTDFDSLFQLHKRDIRRPKQCVLVPPPPTFDLTPPSSPADGNDDQSPLLPSPSRGQAGTIRAQSACGDIGASVTITPISGPNGAISWLTCGINSTSGWTPSFATVQDIITADLASVLSKGNTPFARCNDYLDIIETYAAQYEGGVEPHALYFADPIFWPVPAILVASFAMQESGCHPDSEGQGGEQGMMQISQDKCGGAPDGNCKDPDFNIHQGTRFLAETLAKNKGNLLLTIGQYNGWFPGMTFQDATADAQTDCCHCQQNLDYLFQMVNGWLLNRDPQADPRLGVYFNIDVC